MWDLNVPPVLTVGTTRIAQAAYRAWKQNKQHLVTDVAHIRQQDPDAEKHDAAGLVCP